MEAMGVTGGHRLGGRLLGVADLLDAGSCSVPASDRHRSGRATGWWPVALCAAAAVVVAAWGATVALVAASALLLLDVVGIILPGIGLSVHPVAVVSRAACLAGGV